MDSYVHVKLRMEHTYDKQTYLAGDILLLPMPYAADLKARGVAEMIILPVDRDIQGMLNYALSNVDRAKPGCCSIPDIFEALDTVKLPETVYIVGAGKSALEGIKRIPDDACKIGLNSAIRIPDGRWCWWMVMDHNALHLPWWKPTDVPDGCRTLFGWLVIKTMMLCPQYEKRADYGFTSDPPLGKSGEQLTHGSLRRAGTVLGAALQFCHWAGAKHVIMTGCEQSGPEHWYGAYHQDQRYDGVWGSACKLDQLIKEMTKHGMTVQSLTPTALKVEVIDEL